MLNFGNMKEVVIPQNGIQKQVLAIFNKDDVLMWRRKYSVDNFRLTNIDKSESISVTLTNNYTTQQYSIDEGLNWANFDTSNGKSQTITLTPFSTVIFRTTTDVGYDKSSQFSMVGNGKVVASGKIMSLRKVNYENADGPVCFESLFNGCTQLVKADFVLPPTTYTVNYLNIYNYSDFSEMFSGCVGLVWVPTGMLPASILVPDCYNRMFYECSSLKQAPYLEGYPLYYSDAQAYATGFYNRMFYNCSSLNYLKCTIPVSGFEDVRNYNLMLSGVAPTGKLVKNSAVDESYWRSGYVGMPSGWTVSNY